MKRKTKREERDCFDCRVTHRSFFVHFPLRTLFNEISTIILSRHLSSPRQSLNRVDRLNPLDEEDCASVTPFLPVFKKNFVSSKNRSNFPIFICLSLFFPSSNRTVTSILDNTSEETDLWNKNGIFLLIAADFSIPSSKFLSFFPSGKLVGGGERGGNCKRRRQLALEARRDNNVARYRVETRRRRCRR